MFNIITNKEYEKIQNKIRQLEQIITTQDILIKSLENQKIENQKIDDDEIDDDEIDDDEIDDDEIDDDEIDDDSEDINLLAVLTITLDYKNDYNTNTQIIMTQNINSLPESLFVGIYDYYNSFINWYENEGTNEHVLEFSDRLTLIKRDNILSYEFRIKNEGDI